MGPMLKAGGWFQKDPAVFHDFTWREARDWPKESSGRAKEARGNWERGGGWVNREVQHGDPTLCHGSAEILMTKKSYNWCHHQYMMDCFSWMFLCRLLLSEDAAHASSVCLNLIVSNPFIDINNRQLQRFLRFPIYYLFSFTLKSYSPTRKQYTKTHTFSSFTYCTYNILSLFCKNAATNYTYKLRKDRDS